MLIDTGLDDDISVLEVRKALARAKNGKAVGYDSIPTEVIRNDEAIFFLHKLFNVCFYSGCIPDVWNRGIINPIPKSSTADQRDPLNYRGITMASSIYKLYCGILNCRLSKWAETNSKLVDPQNGFRKGRSCGDHLSTLSEIVNTRKQKGLSTFVSFVDFSKAFDRVDRNLLWLKLERMGVNGKFMCALKSIYRNVQCCVRINGVMSQWFPVKTGLKQGCLLSPLLFSMYINDLAEEINEMNIGIKIDDEWIAILMFAGDIALLAENEADLQKLLDKLNSWCNKWKMVINHKKTQVIHFRPPSVAKTQTNFTCGNANIETVEKYRYLGLVFNEFMDMSVMAKVVAQAAS